MQAGQLRHRITIEAPTGTQNEYGEPVEGWSTLAEVWASREDLTGRELFTAQQVMAQVTTRFVTRYLDGVNAKVRIVSDGVSYNAVSVADPDGRKRTLIILATREG